MFSSRAGQCVVDAHQFVLLAAVDQSANGAQGTRPDDVVVRTNSHVMAAAFKFIEQEPAGVIDSGIDELVDDMRAQIGVRDLVQPILSYETVINVNGLIARKLRRR